jgi:hypothetical protein
MLYSKINIKYFRRYVGLEDDLKKLPVNKKVVML